MYRVIRPFFDREDSNFPYSPGEVFPRAGKEVSEKRLKSLSTKDNIRRIPLIREVTEDGQSDNPANAESKPRKAKQRK